MDVLRPPTVWVMGQCYCKNVTAQTEDIGEAQEIGYTGGYTDETGWNDEGCDSLDVEETDSGYRLKLDVASAFFRFIIGKKGETKKRLEMETSTQIRIPKPGQEGPIVILSRERKGIVSAKIRIDVMVDSARQRQPFTHFLSFPVIDASIKNSYKDFKDDVLRGCDGDRGIDTSIFKDPDKLHLTLGTLVLLDEREIQQAQNLLEDCQTDLIGPILKGVPEVAYFQGLEYMNDDPNAVDVLYAKVVPMEQDEPDRLQILSDRIVDKFVSSGLMLRDYDNVKLHATVMNTLFRKDPSGTAVPSTNRSKSHVNERESFDATNVLRLFGNYTFGKQVISSLHISQRYSTGPDGYYGCAAKVDLPT